MTQPHELAAHVRARTTDARIERQWAALEAAGLPGPVRPGPRRWLAFASGAGLVLAGVVGLALLRGEAPLAAGALIESTEQQVAVQLEDGSRVQLAPQSQLRLRTNLRDAVELDLDSGRASFAIAHAPAATRRFVVHLGPVAVRVVGTRFSLSREARGGGALLGLSVSEGIVEVRRADLPDEPAQRLHAGEHWSALLPSAGAPDARAARPPPANDDAAASDAEHAAPEPTEAEQAAREQAAPEQAEPEHTAPLAMPQSSERTTPRARGHAAPRTAAEGRAGGPDPSAPAQDAAEIFQRATLARRAGRMRDAADAYAELLEQHPNDGRVGLSAFELGRIRMDALADPRGAITALERALAQSAATSFHEDALARIVVASDALGDTAGCQKARARYLARYPKGVHALALAARCR